MLEKALHGSKLYWAWVALLLVCGGIYTVNRKPASSIEKDQ